MIKGASFLLKTKRLFHRVTYRTAHLLIFTSSLMLISACEKSPSTELTSTKEMQVNEGEQEVPVDSSSYRTIEWLELLPEDDLQALLNPPDYLNDIVDGSMEDQIASKIQSAMSSDDQAQNAYEEALVSTRFVEDMNGQNIRVPGYVVPIESEFVGEGAGYQLVKRFFLVPFFGACLHMPPPPPNQIIYVTSEEGFKLPSIYDPVWVSGGLKTALYEDQLATAAYVMDMVKLEPY